MGFLVNICPLNKLILIVGLEMTGKSLKFMRILSTQNILFVVFQYDETETQNKDREALPKRHYAFGICQKLLLNMN